MTSPVDLDPELLASIADRAVAWAREAGTLALSAQSEPLAVEYKGQGRRDPVTAIDREVEERIRALVSETFPGQAVLGEETAAIGDEPAIIWVVDPIDGTANFAGGLPFWAVSIGVLFYRQPVAAAIYVPAGPAGVPVVYHARKGGGAFCEAVPLAVASNERPEPAGVIGVPGSWSRVYQLRKPLGKAPGEPRVLGSIAFELALTAAGVLQYSIYGGPKIWDCAAGVLLVQEAGGVVLAKHGRRWEPLDRFDPPSGASGPSGVGKIADLAAWRQALACGNPILVAFVTANVRRRVSLRYLLLSWLRRMRRPQVGRV